MSGCNFFGRGRFMVGFWCRERERERERERGRDYVVSSRCMFDVGLEWVVLFETRGMKM